MKRRKWTSFEIIGRLGRPSDDTTHLSLSRNLEKVSAPHLEDAFKHFYSALVSLPASILLSSHVLEPQPRTNVLRRYMS